MVWRNWSGSVEANPRTIAHPRDADELRQVILGGASVRATGAGHSFMPLCRTDDTLIGMADYRADMEIAADRRSAWAPAGWGLERLTGALWDEGLSLENQGDVNPQSLAGALATGTHGTGADLGSLSTQALAYELMLADGSLVVCDPDTRPDLWQAQRLSLGLLGIATRIRIRVVPAYHLEERVERRPLAEMAERWRELAATTRHFEFFVFPYADQVIFKTLDPVPGGADDLGEGGDIDEAPFRLACRIGRRVPALIPPLQRLMMRASGKPGRRAGPAWRIFPSDRSIRFEEMEYEVPRADGMAALLDAVAHIRRHRLPVAFPFEFRLCAADDIWMSPFRDSAGASISMHQYAPMAWRPAFAAIEPIFQAAGGRPHWAKRHTLTPAQVHDLYPRTEAFLRVRGEVDPDGRFLNPELAALFGISRHRLAAAA